MDAMYHSLEVAVYIDSLALSSFDSGHFFSPILHPQFLHAIRCQDSVGYLRERDSLLQTKYSYCSADDQLHNNVGANKMQGMILIVDNIDNIGS